MRSIRANGDCSALRIASWKNGSVNSQSPVCTHSIAGLPLRSEKRTGVHPVGCGPGCERSAVQRGIEIPAAREIESMLAPQREAAIEEFGGFGYCLQLCLKVRVPQYEFLQFAGISPGEGTSLHPPPLFGASPEKVANPIVRFSADHQMDQVPRAAVVHPVRKIEVKEIAMALAQKQPLAIQVVNSRHGDSSGSGCGCGFRRRDGRGRNRHGRIRRNLAPGSAGSSTSAGTEKRT